MDGGLDSRYMDEKPTGAGEPFAFATVQPGESLPLFVRPVSDVGLAELASRNRGLLEEKLTRHGALLFRGFGITEAGDFEGFVRALCDDLFDEEGEHPRLAGKVYQPVFYPPEQKLLWHNENTFDHRWPGKIWFGCARVADEGGETPIVDSRRVYESIDSRIRDEFVRRGVAYIRNDYDWQTTHGTSDEAEVEAKCRLAGVETEWRREGHLRTRGVRPAVVAHPSTGELSWINQAHHWHPSCFEPAMRDSMTSMFEEEDLPWNCQFGDGSPISDDDMAEILRVYQNLEVSIPWKDGDVLMVDNIFTAHGRNPFRGERELFIAMGDMTTYDEVIATD